LALATLTAKHFFVTYYQQYQCSFSASWRSGKTQHHPVFKIYVDWSVTAQLKRSTYKHR